MNEEFGKEQIIREGYRTTEFWVGVCAAVLTTIQQTLFPDSPFPQAEFTTIVVWVVSRLGEKALTAGDPTKRAWKTSQFWIAIAFAIVGQFVSIPDNIALLVDGYIISRSATTASKDISLAAILGTKKEIPHDVVKL